MKYVIRPSLISCEFKIFVFKKATLNGIGDLSKI